MRCIQKLFGGEGEWPGQEAADGVLPGRRLGGSGAEKDLLVGYEAALKRNTEAARSEGRGDVEGAIQRYKVSVA